MVRFGRSWERHVRNFSETAYVHSCGATTSYSLLRSLRSDAQHQSVGAAVRPLALIKSNTIMGSSFKIATGCNFAGL